MKRTKPKVLKIVWSDGHDNWHHNFDIVASSITEETLVVHITPESLTELLDADRCGV